MFEVFQGQDGGEAEISYCSGRNVEEAPLGQIKDAATPAFYQPESSVNLFMDGLKKWLFEAPFNDL